MGSVLASCVFFLMAAGGAAGWAASAKAGPLDYDTRAVFPSTVSEAGRGWGYTVLEVNFPSPVRSPFKSNNTVWATWYLPDGQGPHACVLLLPVMAAPNLWIEDRFRKALVRRGFAVLVLEMPYQFRRRPAPLVPTGQVFLARTPERLAFNFRQAALDVRRALTWLSRRPEVDPDRIGLLGISLGALVGGSVYAVDPRPRAAALLLGGAGYGTLLRSSSMTGPFLQRAGIREDDIRRAFRGLDPLEHAPVKGRRVLLVNAREDRVVPRASALRLEEVFTSADPIWVPFGHYGAVLHLVWMPRYVSSYFVRELAPGRP